MNSSLSFNRSYFWVFELLSRLYPRVGLRHRWCNMTRVSEGRAFSFCNVFVLRGNGIGSLICLYWQVTEKWHWSCSHTRPSWQWMKSVKVPTTVVCCVAFWWTCVMFDPKSYYHNYKYNINMCKKWLFCNQVHPEVIISKQVYITMFCGFRYRCGCNVPANYCRVKD